MTIVKLKRTKKDILDEYNHLYEKPIFGPRKRIEARKKLRQLEKEWNELPL